MKTKEAREVEEGCGGCKSLEEEIYWGHIKRISFCVAFHSDFHHKLQIPKKFADNLRLNILHPKVTLRGPSRASWEVNLIRSGDGLFLQDGWEEFVNAYSLQENDILFFKYDRISSFNIKIFDGECEKVAAYFVKKCGHMYPHQNGSTDKEVPSADQNTPEATENSSPGFEKVALPETIGRPRSSLRPKKIASPAAVEYVSNRRRVTDEEKTQALKKAASELTDNSFFLALPISSCYKFFFLTIPARFASYHLGLKNQEVILRVGDKKWTTKFSFSRGGFGPGWKQFALENNLEESDACLFKLVRQENGETVMLDVSIFRVVDVVTPPTLVAAQ